MFKLKPKVPAFTIVDGPGSPRSFKHEEAYTEKDIPPQEADKFEEISPKLETRNPKPAPKGGTK